MSNSDGNKIEDLYTARIPKTPSREEKRAEKKNIVTKAFETLERDERENIEKRERLSALKKKIEEYLDPHKDELKNTRVSIEKIDDSDNPMYTKSNLTGTEEAINTAYPGIFNRKERQRANNHHISPSLIIRNTDNKKYFGILAWPDTRYKIAVSSLTDNTFAIYKGVYKPPKSDQRDYRGGNISGWPAHWESRQVKTKITEQDVLEFAQNLLVEELAIARGDMRREPTKRINTPGFSKNFKIAVGVGIAATVMARCALVQADEIPSRDIKEGSNPTEQTMDVPQAGSDEHIPS